MTPLRVCDLQRPRQPSGQAEDHLGDNGSGEGLLLGTPGALSRLLGANRHHPDPAVSSAQLWLYITHLEM